MASAKLRSRRAVLEQVGELATTLRAGLAQLPGGARDPRVVDAVWQGEGLGVLLWALELVELPPFDLPFDANRLLQAPLRASPLRAQAEIEHARETARLWHWRARTSIVRSSPDLRPPERWQSFEQLVAVAAMRGHERGLLPPPLRGDFSAFGTGYRDLSTAQQGEALSISYERHRALNWLCGEGKSWAETPTDT